VTKYEIIERIAREKRVEQMVAAHCKPARAEHADIVQMIYLALLESDDDTIVRAWEENWINYKIAKILTNYYDLKRSAFNNLFRNYSSRAVEITDGAATYEQQLERSLTVRSGEDLQTDSR